MEESKRKYRYFLYSQAQETMRIETENRAGKQFILGKVLVNGVWKPFTQISTSAENVMYADSKLVTKGYLDELKYQECSTKWKVEV